MSLIRYSALAASCLIVAGCGSKAQLNAQGQQVQVVTSQPAAGCTLVGKFYGSGVSTEYAQNNLRNISAEDGANTVHVTESKRWVWDNLWPTNVGITGNDHTVYGTGYRC